MKLKKTKYPKNIETVRLLLSLGVNIDDSFSLCGYTELQKERKKHLVRDTIKLIELNKKLDENQDSKEDIQINITVDGE